MTGENRSLVKAEKFFGKLDGVLVGVIDGFMEFDESKWLREEYEGYLIGFLGREGESLVEIRRTVEPSRIIEAYLNFREEFMRRENE